MREPAGADRVHALARELGAVTRPGTRLYLTGGATAVLVGWRESTIDVDIRVEPEDEGLLRRMVELKEEMQINVELASPPDFIPELPAWRERSPLAISEGNLEVRHFDFYSQALSKLERGFDLDLVDVREMVERGLIDPPRAIEFLGEIEGELYRYPAIDGASFRSKVERALA